MWVDLGFTGFEKDYPDTLVIIPKKKPKGKELTADAKAWNRIVSGFRVLVEHAIGALSDSGQFLISFATSQHVYFSGGAPVTT